MQHSSTGLHFSFYDIYKPPTMKPRFTTLLSLLLVLLPAALRAQSPAGIWDGTLSFAGSSLPLTIRITETPDGYAATLESPDQGLRGLPADSVDFRNPDLAIAFDALHARYRGALMPGGMVMGVFHQNGQDFPLLLKNRPATIRSQEPQPPYPYICREVSFPSRAGGVELNGTLTLPAEGAPRAAVILVTGSGLQNRDEEILGHKPFLVITDHLTRCGYAVLRYDDRGFRAPEPEQHRLLDNATTDDFTLDALGAFDYLAALRDTTACPVGILGHSEGGTIAFAAAAREPRVDFIVSMAGLAVRGDRASLGQNRRLMELQGLDKALTEDCCTLLEAVYAEIRSHTREELAAESAELKMRLTAREPAASLPQPIRENLLQLLDGAAANAWVYHFLTCDPAEAIAAAGNRPVLAINGTLDRQVDAGENLGAIRRLLAQSPALTVKAFEGLNHLFQPCTTGDAAEYERIETTIAPEVLDMLTAWLDHLTDSRS